MAKANMRQQLFVEAYIATKGNGAESARRAGYKGNDATLRVQATRLLTNANVRSMLAERTEKALVKVHKRVTPEDVMTVLAEQMDGAKPAKWREGDKEFNPLGAATVLGKFLGLEKPSEAGHTTVNILQVLSQFDAQTLETLRAAWVKALPQTVDAG